MWALNVAILTIIVLAAVLSAILLMFILTFAALKLNITFYQSAFIFGGVAVMFPLGGFLYRKANTGE